MGKECNTCVFNTKRKNCKLLNERIDNCWAWADEAEYERRKADMEKYEAYCYGAPEKKLSKEAVEKRQRAREANYKERGGKSVTEILDEHFNWYYLQGLTDKEVSKKLCVDRSRITEYRNKKGLPA